MQFLIFINKHHTAMNDNYTHIDSNVVYVVENILGPAEKSSLYEDINSNFNSQITDHCICNGTCDQQICTCLRKSVDSLYFPDKMEHTKSPISIKECDYLYPVMECNDLCSCSNNCGNRIVQRGPVDSLYVKKCSEEGKGLGLFTEHQISRGTFICEYAGEVITKSQALQRHEKNLREGKMNYIFCLQEYSDGDIVQTFIDPSQFGNIGRYINHSCEPNCIVIPARVNTIIPKLAIFSYHDITAHSEITFNYGSYNTAVTNLESNKKKKCMCNSTDCKEWLPFNIF